MNGLLLFLGLVVLTAAFFHCDHPLLRRMGVLSVGVTTFAAGYLATGNAWVGAASAAAWLFLPWVEIFLRVRKLRLPLHKQLRQSPPPPREMFPDLEDISGEIEAAGFEHVADLEWGMEGYRQFLRLFVNPARREEAAITHVEQNQLGFHFTAISSRGSDGTVFTTWDCPVSSGLKTAPGVHLNRSAPGQTFEAMADAHADFLRRCGRGPESLVSGDGEAVRSAVERDMELQMRHNLDAGLLMPSGDGHGRYSWRGMFYLWLQVLRDLFRAC